MARSRRPGAIYEPDYVYLATKLREAREESGLTQAQVARYLGKASSYVSKVELRERYLDAMVLKQLADLYEKPLEFFYLPRDKTGRRAKG